MMAAGRTSEAPRVLVLTPGLDGTDGVSEVSRQAIAALAGAWGREAVEVWTLAGGAGDDARMAGIRLRSAAGGRTRLAAWALSRSRDSMAGSLVLVMHVHLAPLALVLAMRGAPVAIFLHGIEVWATLRRRESAALERASVLVANSQHTAARFRDANPRFANRTIAVCHLGVGPSSVAFVRPPLDGYALIVGRLVADERYKGHDALINAWPEVRARVPNAELVVVGDGNDRPRLERLAEERGVGDCVVFTGRASDAELAGWYRHASFFAMPSRNEGFGLVYVEAMRAGKACLAAPGVAQEIIEDGTTGIIVDPEDAARLTHALIRLFTDTQERERMGRAAAERVADTFEARHFGARLLAQLTPLTTQVV
jgi:phosphatidylinositol alpha-1,6-mannosyltransferase